MTNITLRPVDIDGSDRDALVELIASIVVPFHVTARPSAERIAGQVAEGEWGGSADGDGDHATFFVDVEGGTVGVVRLDDITDDAPLFDLRIREDARGRGIGLASVQALQAHVFENYPEVDRLEGQTREDNVPMRRLFQKAGWTKEAHYRRGWPVDGQEPVASVAYAILRSEHETGEKVPLIWEDLA